MSSENCLVPGCKDPIRARGNCHRHEMAHRRVAQRLVQLTGCTLAEADQSLVNAGLLLPSKAIGPRPDTYVESTARSLVGRLRKATAKPGLNRRKSKA